MAKRGRPSSASLAIASIGPAGIEAVQRPRPPADLTEEQAKEWQIIVNRLPADWFPPETYPLLEAYCRHIVTMRRIAQLIQSMESSEEFDIRGYDYLLRCQARESQCLMSLAVKMRISQSSTYDKSKKKPPVQRKPWE